MISDGQGVEKLAGYKHHKGHSPCVFHNGGIYAVIKRTYPMFVIAVPKGNYRKHPDQQTTYKHVPATATSEEAFVFATGLFLHHIRISWIHT